MGGSCAPHRLQWANRGVKQQAYCNISQQWHRLWGLRQTRHEALDNCRFTQQTARGSSRKAHASASLDSTAGGGAEGFVERSSNGTQTTYVDRDYMKSKLAGILQVQLKGASGLPARDMWGSSDPYCIASIGESCHTTKVVARSLEPVWAETFFLYVRNTRLQKLILRVNDRDVFSSDDGLGYAMCDLEKLCDGDLHDLDVDLHGDGGGGHVQLSLKFLPFTDSLVDVGQADMGGPVEGAPQSEMSSAWRALARITGAAADELFKPICYIDNPETDTQVWMFANNEKRRLVVAFRGTEQVKWKDLVTDMWLEPAPFNLERVFDKSPSLFTRLQRSTPATRAAQAQQAGLLSLGLPLPNVTRIMEARSQEASPAGKKEADWLVERDGDDNEPWVHRGFLTAYDSVRARVMNIVDEVLDDGTDEPWQIHVTGHSLGGALATLCAFELVARRYRTTRSKPQINMVNFGSPRVGNVAFAADFNRLVPDAWRVTNHKDVIPRVPRLMGYSHVGNAVCVKADGTFEINGESPDWLDEGAVLEDVVPQLAELVFKAKGEDRAASSQPNQRGGFIPSRIERLIDHELAFLSTLVSGDALSEHMEDFYLTSLKAVVDAGLAVGREVGSEQLCPRVLQMWTRARQLVSPAFVSPSQTSQRKLGPAGYAEPARLDPKVVWAQKGARIRAMSAPSWWELLGERDALSDMEVVRERVVQLVEHSLSVPATEAALLATEYLKFMTLKSEFSGQELSPSPRIDQVWHAHLLDTRSYRTLEAALGSGPLDHDPLRSLDCRSFWQLRFLRTLNLLVHKFKTPVASLLDSTANDPLTAVWAGDSTADMFRSVDIDVDGSVLQLIYHPDQGTTGRRRRVTFHYNDASRYFHEELTLRSRASLASTFPLLDEHLLRLHIYHNFDPQDTTFSRADDESVQLSLNMLVADLPSTVVVQRAPVPELEIHLQKHYGDDLSMQTMRLEEQAHTTELFQALMAREGVCPLSELELLCGGVEIKAESNPFKFTWPWECAVLDTALGRGAVLHLHKRSGGPRPVISLSVRTLTGKLIALPGLHATDSVLFAKDKLAPRPTRWLQS
ncbi:hypothetical protein WJX72_008191 [[Myrmecia] bisecta]|uniref:C2 domain-containing protein n=1 Tax=[Myrmecia] bisecta TaxID=41462 RepID=A0AAW1R891_9CHLO